MVLATFIKAGAQNGLKVLNSSGGRTGAGIGIALSTLITDLSINLFDKTIVTTAEKLNMVKDSLNSLAEKINETKETLDNLEQVENNYKTYHILHNSIHLLKYVLFYLINFYQLSLFF